MDGTMATTLTPSEDEMNKITEVFGKMRDTVIAASALAKEVGELRSAVGDLRKEVDHLRETNHWLDQQCTELRTQRDQAVRDKAATIDELNRVQVELKDTTHRVDNQRGELVRLNDRIASIKLERDDANFRVLELEEAKAESDKKLQAIKDAIDLKEVPKEPEQVHTAEPEAVNEQPRAETGQFQPKPRSWWEELGHNEPQKQAAEEAPKTDEGYQF